MAGQGLGEARLPRCGPCQFGRFTASSGVTVLAPEGKVCFLGRPRQSINSRGGVAFERIERHPQTVDAEVVEERSEPLLHPLPCGFPMRTGGCRRTVDREISRFPACTKVRHASLTAITASRRAQIER
jgi:hypothetical protein